ncbi:MAG TPA: hypothetical protein VGS21_03320, partial [Acidimicrobiales bacterium]|nr:hypothetical protein [Acidimicrobiales bacterium]
MSKFEKGLGNAEKSGRKQVSPVTAAVRGGLVLLAGGAIAACGSVATSAGNTSGHRAHPASGTHSSKIDTTGTITTGNGGGSTSGGGTTTTTTPPPPPPAPLLEAGQQGTDASIPWSEVGAGWQLTIWA